MLVMRLESTSVGYDGGCRMVVSVKIRHSKIWERNSEPGSEVRSLKFAEGDGGENETRDPKSMEDHCMLDVGIYNATIGARSHTARLLSCVPELVH